MRIGGELLLELGDVGGQVRAGVVPDVEAALDVLRALLVLVVARQRLSLELEQGAVLVRERIDLAHGVAENGELVAQV